MMALLKPSDFRTMMFKQYCNPEETPLQAGFCFYKDLKSRNEVFRLFLFQY
jgi:hypothetical protein